MTDEKRGFIGRIPGFRSGTWWKKVIASILYLFILLTIIGILLPGPSIEDNVKNGRKYLSENKYDSAIYSYKQALEKWETGKDYAFSKEDIEKELKGVRTAYAKQIAAEAKRKLDAGDINKANEILREAQRQDASIEEIATISEQITKMQAQEKANRLLDEALTAFNSSNLEEAISKFKSAVSLSSDNPRNIEVKEKLAPAIKNKTEEYIAAATKALNEWNIAEAEGKIALVAVFAPENEQLIDLKKRLTEAQSTIKEIGQKPVNSAWDAAIKPVQDFLKKNLKDPESVKYDEWSPVILASYGGEKCWAVRCRYRAKNSFGGYVLTNQIFYIRNNQVVGYKDY